MGIERMAQLSLLLGRPHLASQAASVFVRCTSSSHVCFNPGSGLFWGVVEGGVGAGGEAFKDMPSGHIEKEDIFIGEQSRLPPRRS